MQELTIRLAQPDDAEALLQIYAYYVEHTAISFEFDVPSKEEFRARIETTLMRYPYLVAQRGGQIVGYAYAGTFKPRPAYDRSVETTIYLAKDCKNQGIGKTLYAHLEQELRRQNITNLYACIAVPVNDDPYVDTNSMDFHAHLGYRLVGTFQKCGYKFGHWYDMVWMEKYLVPHVAADAFIPYSELK